MPGEQGRRPERVRSRTPSAIADVLCRAINLEARRPSGQPLYHEELACLEAGYRALTGCAPPDGHDDPLARAVARGAQQWQPRAAAKHPARLGRGNDSAIRIFFRGIFTV